MQVLERKFSPVTTAFRNPPLGLQLNQRIARDFKPRWDQQWGGSR
jgi:CAI-1 autoinducer synthase